MIHAPIRKTVVAALFFAAAVAARTASASQAVDAKTTIQLTLDARNVQFRVVYSTLKLDVKPGPLTLLYPKWIPGMHRVGGPINNLVGLKMSAGGKTIPWHRDADDGFAFHCNIPDGCKSLEIRMAYSAPVTSYATEDSHGGIAVTSTMAVINWNALFLYPKGFAADNITIVPTLRLPDDWKHGTALTTRKSDKSGIHFEPASMTEVIDSPVLAGSVFRVFELGDDPVPHRLVVTADRDKNLDHVGELVKPLKRLILECKHLFGKSPFRRYQFLLHLSSRMPLSGLEHHESTIVGDYPGLFGKGVYPTYLFMVMAHEYVHAWNGKHRRPKGMVCRDFHQPHRTGMLWVYEGLTQYLGMVLAVRCRAWTPDRIRNTFAVRLGTLAHLRQRAWRPLADAAIGSPSVNSPPGSAWRNRNDYYDEGSLLWLQVDALIRKRTDGKRSLDDFCKRFFDSPKPHPSVREYDFDELVAALGETMKYDWNAYLNARLNALNATPMLEGVALSGWKLDLLPRHRTDGDFRYSLGMSLSVRAVREVLPESPAAKAGLIPNWRLSSVNTKKTNIAVELRNALTKSKKDGTPITIELQPPDVVTKPKTVTLIYRGGNRHPWLVRLPDQPDVMADILRPRAVVRESN